MEIVFILIGLLVGFIIAYLLFKLLSAKSIQAEKQKIVELEKELIVIKTQTATELSNLQAKVDEKQVQIVNFQDEISAKDKIVGAQNVKLAEKDAEIKALNEKLIDLKEEIEKIGEKYAAEFKNIANEILEDKSRRFTQSNKENIEAILKPLGDNIKDFEKSVRESYQTEANERFSLGKEVKRLAELNQQMSVEAQNLTRALKGEAKTQGDWGEMILENILEMSGLRKDEEYFIQKELRDEAGNPLRSQDSDKKMRPDAIIKYPDERSIIIDSKVSLNAYLRYVEATDADEQKRELDAHVAAVKAHILDLSKKGYDDYDKSLDFVMMFIPNEPAYIAAMQGDKDLWSFAYEKRILLMNPTNLIASLRLIVDLWKREYQNRNALLIAERGAFLYDKFVGFVESFELIGSRLQQADETYQKAYGQLASGRGNLIGQAEEMKKLGLKTKKDLSKYINETEKEMPTIEE